ncbi:hypothetical protein PG993_013221 [Apiospora rasikravindrae]|uniref:Uncharacterized protein n=1 Tax=Apiospora rasikravindrae TaxID=990691 RepID=A0ABR1RX17_9PEZI
MGNGNCNKTSGCSQQPASADIVATSLKVTFSWDVGSNEKERGLPPVGALKRFAHRARLPLLLVSLQQCLAKKSQVSLGKTPNKTQQKLREAVERRRKGDEASPPSLQASAELHDDFIMVQQRSKAGELQRQRPAIGFVPRVIIRWEDMLTRNRPFLQLRHRPSDLLYKRKQLKLTPGVPSQQLDLSCSSLLRRPRPCVGCLSRRPQQHGGRRYHGRPGGRRPPSLRENGRNHATFEISTVLLSYYLKYLEVWLSPSE